MKQRLAFLMLLCCIFIRAEAQTHPFLPKLEVITIENVNRLEQVGMFEGLFSIITDLEFSPDGQLLAGASGGMTLLWEVESDELVATLGTFIANDNHSLAFSRDGALLATLHQFRPQVWDISALLSEDIYHPQNSPCNSAPATNIVFGHENSLLITSGNDAIEVCNISTGELVITLPEVVPRAGDIAVSPDGELLAAASSSRVSLWDLQTGQLLAALDCGTVPHIEFNVDGTALSVFTLSRVLNKPQNVHLWVWEIETLIEYGYSDLCATGLRYAAFSPDGTIIVTSRIDLGQGSASNYWLRLWNVQTGAKLMELGTASTAIAFSPNQKLIASAQFGGVGSTENILLWGIPSTSP